MPRAPRKLSSNVRLVTTKTQFGVDSSMVVTDEDILSKLSSHVTETETLVRDDQGIFAVASRHIDSGFVCQVRTSEAYRGRWAALTEEAGIDLTPEK